MKLICDYNECTACQACKQICPTDAISMQENERGFFYPSIDADRCIDCHKCQRVCPAINLKTGFIEPISVFAGWIKDEKNRHYSTSGGAAYALSKKVVEEGGVVCGCRWNVDHAEHTFANNIDELRQFQGSKYAQSDLGNCFSKVKDFLLDGRKVLFIGTGCHVAGLKSFLEKDFDNLLTVDLLCHGLPSQRALRDRISYVEEKNGKKVVDMRFRDKLEDHIHTYCKYTFEDGTSFSCPVYHDPFFRAFDSNYLLRPNCFLCHYAQSKRISDLTIADFWGYIPGGFSFLNYHQGVSLILANTNKGINILRDLTSLKYEDRPFSMAKACNRNLKAPQNKPAQYELFWRDYLSGMSLEELSPTYYPNKVIPPVNHRTSIIKNFIKLLLFREDRVIDVKSLVRKYGRWLYGPVLSAFRKIKQDIEDRRQCEWFESLIPGQHRVYYFGITNHPNLGDLAQRYCITNWIKENYKNYELVMVKSDVIVNPKFTKRFFDHLKSIFKKEDIIVFQSGYCTQDLGGNHPLMHRLVCEYMADAHILMMPQTIFFKEEGNRRICAENHNKAKNMLFLARDFVSYEQAKQMFPDIHVEAFPDIVTTLIGTMRFCNNRNGICLCTRNDGEKLYSQEQINELANRLESSSISVVQKDTQANRSVDELVNNLKHYIEAEIETYSHFQLTITDRYHGTIFSLCAGTPVILLKTTDHKVITGADWFKGVYDEYVYVADDLNDAYKIAQIVLKKDLNYELQPYFKTHYYDNLRQTFENASLIS